MSRLLRIGGSMKFTCKALSLLSLVMLIGCAQNKGGLASNSDGKLTSSIIGGKPVPANTVVAKSTVAIYDVERGALCTGSIITQDVILTAAHCVQGGNPANYRIIFGLVVDKTAEIRKVVAMKYNAKWDKSDQAAEETPDLGDVGIIKIDGALPDGYQPARMLSAKAPLKDGQEVMLAGYGLTDGVSKTGEGSLRYAVVKIKNAAFGKSEVLVDQSAGQGACHGDSGGPAYAKDADGKLSLFGITSRGINDPLDQCGSEAVYTNAVALKTWIKAALVAVNKPKQARLVARR